MDWQSLLMFAIFILGIMGRSDIIAAAAGVLLVLHLIGLNVLFPYIEEKSLELGLFFLVLYVLVPFAAGRVTLSEIAKSFVSVQGIVAVISGALATHLNNKGLEMLQLEPSLIIGLVMGSIIGVVFF
ncbi:MAG: hypothetical protein XD50_0404 [Clostridia bacterium 41_269]|nr:MAG: hypothetical protein XD50_0404 [Clostridia bacterium 41_269]